MNGSRLITPRLMVRTHARRWRLHRARAVGAIVTDALFYLVRCTKGLLIFGGGGGGSRTVVLVLSVSNRGGNFC